MPQRDWHDLQKSETREVGTVVRFPRSYERPLSKRELGRVLGRSTRWIELRQREGLPAYWLGSRRRYLLSEVLQWLDARPGQQG